MTDHFKKHGYIHGFWIIVILCLVIVGLVVRNPSANLINDFVSFAATIASLFLAVVAIFYSIISNQSLSGAITGTIDAALRITQVSERIDSASKRLSEETTRLVEEVSLVPASVDRLSADLGVKLEAFSETRVSGDSSTGTISDDKSIKAATYGTSMAMYCLAVAFKSSKDIDVDKIKVESTSYFGGLLGGFLSAIRIFSPCGMELEGVGGSYRVISFGKLDPNKFTGQDFSSAGQLILDSKKAVDKVLGVDTSDDADVDEAKPEIVS